MSGELAAELNGVRAIDVVQAIPRVGTWHADISVEAPSDAITLTPAGAKLTISGLTMVGTLVRAPSPYQGALRVRVVGGAGGWRQSVKPKFYQSDAGVSLALVCGDAAREVGERIEVTSDRIVGTAFVREACPASRVLQQLAPRDWYMRADGVTVLGPRAADVITSRFDVLEHDGALNRFVIATEVPIDWQPGRRFVTAQSGTRTISAVIHTSSAGSLRTEVLCVE